MHQSFSLSLMNPNDVPDFAVFARFFKEPSIIMKGLSMLLPQFFRMVISNESENDSWTIWTTICRLKPTYSSFKLYVFSVFCAPIFFTLICKFFYVVLFTFSLLVTELVVFIFYDFEKTVRKTGWSVWEVFERLPRDFGGAKPRKSRNIPQKPRTDYPVDGTICLRNCRIWNVLFLG